ncbi:hypothetical protein BWGOE6_55060 [Bacillus mycoides]|nr:hypothetical protein BWGOE1_55960 [Bacillus mycoides]OFD55281.1 hypothetical protein BWGOE6_55060 [Bacillus mycoides]
MINWAQEIFNPHTWESRHRDLELKVYNCSELSTGYNSRGDGKPRLKDEIHFTKNYIMKNIRLTGNWIVKRIGMSFVEKVK